MAVCGQTEFPDFLPMGLRILLSQQEAGTTIALDGEWDLAGQERMRHVIRNVLAGQPDRVVLDLSRLTFMDSTGIHGVLALASRAAGLNIDLVVIPGPPAVQRLFEFCQLSESVTWVEAA